MHKRSAILSFIFVTCCPIFIGCAGKPITEIREARDAIRSAKEAGAERYALGLLTEAQASYNEADEGAAPREELRELYIRAAMQAKIAQAQAHMKETEELLHQTQADHAKAKEAAAAAKNSAEAAARAVGQPAP